ncbi:MAG: mandelate racemase/muconate lactonizing enzyme family protein, partial [Pseudomonadota bacterium]|nr:mandelate racemase/muconate lactonizing enzyme family protein [Pseudomonadota bacterium]
MSRNSNITSIETISCDAGWRNYYFVKITTTGDVVGWSEYDESFGPKGVTQNINIMGVELIGQSVLNHESIYNQLFRKKRGMFGGVVVQAMGAIENALLDAKAKLLGLPCYELLGGKLRDVIRVYWSHCGPWRMKPRAQYYCDKELESLSDIEKLAFEARQSGFNALKTYPYYLNKVGEMRMWSPGFGQPFQPDLNFDRKFLRDLRDYLEAFRKGAGPDMDIMLDLNFNA